MTGKADYLALGDWNAQCYECGRKFKASQLIRHWQGYFVCPAHYEPRQPQDFVRAVPDQQTPPWVQPMPTDTFVLGGRLLNQSGDLVGDGVTISSTGITRGGVSGVLIEGDGITTADTFIPDPGVAADVTELQGTPTILDGGTGYTAGDVLELSGGTLAPNGTATQVTVDSVTGGVIDSVTVTSPGNYEEGAGPVCASTPDVSVKILLHFDGADGATTTTDECGNTVALGGSSSLSTDQAKFGASSYTGSAATPFNLVTITDFATTILADATGWTIEFFGYYPEEKVTDFSLSRFIIENALGQEAVAFIVYPKSGGPNSEKFVLSLRSAVGLFVNADYEAVAGGISIGAWHHFAITFDAAAGHYYTYCDGVKVHDIADATTVVTGLTTATLEPSTFQGVAADNYVDEFRISAGCKYPGGTTFTPTTTEFSNTGCGVAVTGGTGTGAVITVPTPVVVSYATFNPAHAQSYLSLQNSNLLAQSTASPEFVSAWTVTNVGSTAFQQTGATGLLRYCEFTDPFGNGFDLASVANLNYFGLIKSDFVPTDNTFIGSTSDSYSISTGGLKWNNNSSASFDSNCNQVPVVVGLLFDSVNGTLAVTINGVSRGTAFTGISGSYCPAISLGIGRIITANFGATAWTHEPPTGYVGWTS